MPHFKAEMHKFDLGSGSVRDPAGEADSAPPDPLAEFQGSILLRGEEGGKMKRGKRGKDGREKRGRGNNETPMTY